MCEEEEKGGGERRGRRAARGQCSSSPRGYLSTHMQTHIHMLTPRTEWSSTLLTYAMVCFLPARVGWDGRLLELLADWTEGGGWSSPLLFDVVVSAASFAWLPFFFSGRATADLDASRACAYGCARSTWVSPRRRRIGCHTALRRSPWGEERSAGSSAAARKRLGRSCRVSLPKVLWGCGSGVGLPLRGFGVCV